MALENTIAQMLFGHDLPLDESEQQTVNDYANTFNSLKLTRVVGWDSFRDNGWDEGNGNHQSLSE